MLLLNIKRWEANGFFVCGKFREIEAKVSWLCVWARVILLVKYTRIASFGKSMPEAILFELCAASEVGEMGKVCR